MEIPTKLTTVDYRAYSRHVQRSVQKKYESSFWFNLVLWMVIGLIGTVLLNLFWIHPSLDLPTALFVFAAMVLFYGYYAIQYRRRMMPKEDGFLLGQRIFIIDDSGIKEIRNGHESTTMWRTVVRVVETAEYFFIMLDVLTGYVLPKRSITQEQTGLLKELFKQKLDSKAL